MVEIVLAINVLTNANHLCYNWNEEGIRSGGCLRLISYISCNKPPMAVGGLFLYFNNYSVCNHKNYNKNKSFYKNLPPLSDWIPTRLVFHLPFHLIGSGRQPPKHAYKRE